MTITDPFGLPAAFAPRFVIAGNGHILEFLEKRHIEVRGLLRLVRRTQERS